ncbi:MAG: ABC transporter ATP-binding protein/permease [Armatimonadetes bacterium]|nr:ABC transporter ATP-binding protein/permease [Armatimonadota bacterium]
MTMNDKYTPKNKRAAFGRLANYLRPYGKSVAVGAAANLGFGLIGVIPPLIWGAITDQVVMANRAPYPARVRYLILCALGLLGAYTVGALLSYARAYIMHILGEKVILQVRKDIYARLQTLSVSYFDNRQTGEIMSRVTSDTQVVEEFVNHAADTLVCDAVRLAGMCVIMFSISTTLTLVALIPLPILFFASYTFSRRIRSIYRAVRERLAEISAGVQERISGIRVIKAFAREDHEFESFRADAESYYDERVKAVKLWTRFFPSVDWLTRLGYVAVWVTGPILIMRGEATMGTLVIFSAYVGMFYDPVGNLARINDTIQRSLAAAERIFEVIDEEPLIKDDENAIELPRIQGRVEFDHVTFSYDDGEETLKEICIKAEPGQIVALVGRSGAGKTSIVNLIPRFYDPKAGRVLVDGFDIKYAKQRSLRGQIGMVLQDTFLFNGTVSMNIRYGKLDATEDEIIAAAKAANAHEFICAMPCGYDTEIGERGIKLSGGQKQRIAIARAILADPRILILDEATSSVDSESEYLIHRAMDRLMEGRTTFVIAHRLSTIKHANQIITLENGRVTEIGDHKSLLDQDGVYSQMYSMQFRLDEEL